MNLYEIDICDTERARAEFSVELVFPNSSKDCAEVLFVPVDSLAVHQNVINVHNEKTTVEVVKDRSHWAGNCGRGVA